MLCVGESQLDRQAGNNDAVISGQLDTVLVYLKRISVSTANLIIAYEPVWAIGTGNVASLAQIDDMHGHIRDVLDSAAWAGTDNPILYGGSVNETMGQEIFSLGYVGGALVGGASLDAEKFASLCGGYCRNRRGFQPCLTFYLTYGFMI